MSSNDKPFSEREGFVPPRPVQVMELDKESAARVGETLSRTLPVMRGFPFGLPKENLEEFFAVSREERKRNRFIAALSRGSLEITVSGWGWDDEKLHEEIPRALCRAKGGWRVAFDFCEFVIAKWDDIIAEKEHQLWEAEERGSKASGEIRERLQRKRGRRAAVVSGVNKTLEQMNVGYRLLEKTGRFSAVTSPVEMGAVDDAHVALAPFPAAQSHMQKAVSLFSDRKKPDYANTVKESISAVESLVKEFTGKKMGPGLEKLRRGGFFPHSAFAEALKKHYGFASDAGGIRHAADGKSLEPDADTARFTLVTCAAFVNYMTARKSRESDSA